MVGKGGSVQQVADILPVDRRGVAQIERQDDGSTVLSIRGVPYMSDTPLEEVTNREFVEAARGDVLIAGLGLGFALRPVLAKPEVATVTVLEIEQDVLDLVGARLQACPGGEKLRLVRADVRQWQPRLTWDVIYFDIWPDIAQANHAEMLALHERYRPCLREGGWMRSWTQDLLEAAYDRSGSRPVGLGLAGQGHRGPGEQAPGPRRGRDAGERGNAALPGDPDRHLDRPGRPATEGTRMTIHEMYAQAAGEYARIAALYEEECRQHKRTLAVLRDVKEGRRPIAEIELIGDTGWSTVKADEERNKRAAVPEAIEARRNGVPAE